MTAAGILLSLCVLIPAAAAVLAFGFDPESRLARFLSMTFAILGLLVALVVAGLAINSKARSIHVRASMEFWKVSPNTSAPTFALDLPRSWCFAPSLAAAVAVLFVAKGGSEKSWLIHVQHVAVQGSLSAATLEFGLSMITLSTIGAAISLASKAVDSQKEGLAIGLRWAVTDVCLWLWTVGFLGHGEFVNRAVLIALTFRAAVFPFQGALIRGATGMGVVELFLVPFPPILWGLHWLGPSELPSWEVWRLLVAVATLIPALLGLAAKTWDAATAYFVASVAVWPIAFQHDPATAIALVGLGLASSFSTHLSVATIASAGAVIAPTVSILASSTTRPIPATDVYSWVAVSVAAALLHARRFPTEWEDPRAGVRWCDAVLLLVALCSLGACLFLRPPATVDS